MIYLDEPRSSIHPDLFLPLTFVISTRPGNETWLTTLTLTNCTKEGKRLRIQIAIFFFFLSLQLSYLLWKNYLEKYTSHLQFKCDCIRGLDG